MSQEQPSVGAMLRELRGRGVQMAELGRMLDRSPRMIRKILEGKTSGESYREAVTELHTRGTVSTPPPRRTTADGQVVPVRGHGGTLTSPAVHPAPTPAAEEGAGERPARGRFTEKTTVLPGGARMIEVTAPKTKGAVGRDQANDAFVSAVRRGAQGQRWDTKRVKFQVETSDGRSFPVGDKWGYAVSDVLGNAHGFAGDAMGWLKKQAEHRYTGMERAGVTVTGVTMTVYNNRDQRTN